MSSYKMYSTRRITRLTSLTCVVQPLYQAPGLQDSGKPQPRSCGATAKRAKMYRSCTGSCGTCEGVLRMATQWLLAILVDLPGFGGFYAYNITYLAGELSKGRQ